LLLVNPVAGKGKARAITREITLPILEAAGCIVELRGELPPCEEVVRLKPCDRDNT